MTRSGAGRRSPVPIGAGIAVLLLLTAAAGTAAAEEPAAGYERFGGCPSKEESKTTTSCQLATIAGGHLQIGAKDVQIADPIVLSGGTDPAGEEFKASPRGGLSPVEQEVPGGIVGPDGPAWLTWLGGLFGGDVLALRAVAELAGAPKLTPTAFAIPIKIHLVNPVLGDACYVGSDSNPIELKLTVGTTKPPPPNEPIAGVSPTPSRGSPQGVGVFEGATFVDNAFAVPGASGCSLGFPRIDLDRLVDARAGLPSPAGANETSQDFRMELVSRRFVYP